MPTYAIFSTRLPRFLTAIDRAICQVIGTTSYRFPR